MPAICHLGVRHRGTGSSISLPNAKVTVFSILPMHFSFFMKAEGRVMLLQSWEVEGIIFFALDYIIYSVYICRWNITELSCLCHVLICKGQQLLNLAAFVDRGYILPALRLFSYWRQCYQNQISCGCVCSDLTWPMTIPRAHVYSG